MKILFICLGNICRSVAAEGVLLNKIEAAHREQEFFVDSAGLIDYHEGELADPRMRAAARRRGIDLTHHSRPVQTADFRRFDLIIPMDAQNMRRLSAIAPHDATAEIREAATFFTTPHHELCVPDPYYGEEQDFEHVLDLLDEVCDEILRLY